VSRASICSSLEGRKTALVSSDQIVVMTTHDDDVGDQAEQDRTEVLLELRPAVVERGTDRVRLLP
jgi:hypothetical protein